MMITCDNNPLINNNYYLMSSQASKKKSITHTVSQAVSPSKRPSTTVNQQHLSTMTGPSDVSTVNPRGSRGITQKEVEIEHLKTALYAVSNKLEVSTDHRD